MSDVVNYGLARLPSYHYTIQCTKQVPPLQSAGTKERKIVNGIKMREFGITLLITLSEKEKVITRKFVSL